MNDQTTPIRLSNTQRKAARRAAKRAGRKASTYPCPPLLSALLRRSIAS